MIEGAQLPLHDAPVAPGEVVVGQTLGKYEVLQRLAAGGMAEIFLARMVGVLGFDKLVVIKRILPHLAQRNDFIEMFLDEARIATTLNHANIVATQEVGVHGKSYFMVMEYLAGEDVRAIVRRIARDQGGRLPLEHALNIGVGVAAGLQYAHDKRDRDGKPLQIVHRDVTPQNVVITWDGAVKLLDFGIAKASNRINETRSGSFKGKVPYMSPEQCRGDALDRRSDIFSLGILLHEMTLCRRLFRGETDFQILKQIVEGPITRPRELDPTYDERLQAIVMKALERDPARRYQTARELQEALEQLAHDMRLRLSPLALADYMHRLFADKIGAWERAAAAGDVAKIAGHFATVAAERDADLAAEESSAHYTEPPQSDVQLSSVPDDELGAPRRGGRLVPLLALLTLAIAAALGGWRHRFAPAAPMAVAVRPAAVVATASTARSRESMELPMPEAVPAPPATEPAAALAATATLMVTTSPTGATLVLDGRTLAQRSPARLDTIARVAHTLIVRTASHPGVVQRFMLDAGEEATLEIDLRRTSHASIKRASTSAARAARPSASGNAAATPAPPATAAAPVTPRRDGEGTLVLASSPWCNVTVDGQPRGTTPLNLKLKAGAHEVVLANPEFKIKRTLAVDLEANQTVRKNLDFAPE